MNGALNAVFARPGDHLPRGFAVFHAAEANFAEQIYACVRERFEIFFDHAMLDYRCAGVNFDAARSQRGEGSLSGDGHGFEANDISRPSGRVHFAG